LKEVIRRAIIFNVKNKNNIIYTREEVLPHIHGLIGRYGVFQHDLVDGEVNFRYVTHVIKDIYVEYNKLMCKIKILDTPYGRVLEELYENGIRFNLSCASFGDVDEKNIVHIKKMLGFNVVLENEDAFYTLRDERKIKLEKIKEKYES